MRCAIRDLMRTAYLFLFLMILLMTSSETGFSPVKNVDTSKTDVAFHQIKKCLADFHYASSPTLWV